MNYADQPPAAHVDILETVRQRLNHARTYALGSEHPFVTLTYAQSLDGCIAKVAGETTRISNSLTQRMTHQLRAMHDAILVGINTVLTDDPRLTVRLTAGNNPQPVIIDSRLRCPLDARLFQASAWRPIIVANELACEQRERRLLDIGARVFRVAAHDSDGRVDLTDALRTLAGLGHHKVMIEGGAGIITSVLAQSLANQLLLTISPRFLGGLPAYERSASGPARQVPPLCNLESQWLGTDLIIRADLANNGATVARETWEHPVFTDPGQHKEA
ncbi:MAG: RibD family protein [Pirellulaceae bacterium]